MKLYNKNKMLCLNPYLFWQREYASYFMLFFFAVSLTLFSFSSLTQAAETAKPAAETNSKQQKTSITKTISTSAKQAIVMDFDTGTILFEKNADQRVPTASMSKVLTMYLVFEALKSGQISLDDKFTVSKKAWKMQGSKMWVPVGKKVKVEDLIRGVIVQSGNDATIVLAEGLAGSEEAFAVALNKKAKDLGMNNSHFANASGWPNPDHYSTVHDLAILSKSLIADFPEYYHYFSEKEFTFSKIKQGNRNPLLYRNIGADGIKTGHTKEAGFGIIVSGTNKDGRRVIAVLHGMKNMQERADESAKLLLWGLNSFKNITFFDEKDRSNKILADIPVIMGQKKTVGVIAGKSITATVPKLYINDIKVDLSYKSPLVAPIRKEQAVGKITIHIPGNIPSEYSEVILPLVTKQSVAEKGFMGKVFEKARLLITGKGRKK